MVRKDFQWSVADCQTVAAAEPQTTDTGEQIPDYRRERQFKSI